MDYLFLVNSIKSELCQIINLSRSCTKAQEMIQEEIVQFIRPDKIFCLLLNISVFIRRNQFRADGSINNIKQSSPRLLVYSILSYPFNQIPHQCFRDAGVHAIHRHMVAIIRCPAQCQFRQIARTDDQSVFLVCHIHKQLCPFTCLTVLIRDIMHLGIMMNIVEML